MVGTASILAMIITILICFALPIGLVIYFYKKERIALVTVAVGALVFLVTSNLYPHPAFKLPIIF